MSVRVVPPATPALDARLRGRDVIPAKAAPDHEWSGYYHHASSSWLKPPEGALDGSRVIDHPAEDAQAVKVVYKSFAVRFSQRWGACATHGFPYMQRKSALVYSVHPEPVEACPEPSRRG